MHAKSCQVPDSSKERRAEVNLLDLRERTNGHISAWELFYIYMQTYNYTAEQQAAPSPAAQKPLLMWRLLLTTGLSLNDVA